MGDSPENKTAFIDQVIGQWAMIQRAKRGWDSLAALLAVVPPDETRTELPRPQD